MYFYLAGKYKMGNMTVTISATVFCATKQPPIQL